MVAELELIDLQTLLITVAFELFKQENFHLYSIIIHIIRAVERLIFLIALITRLIILIAR